MLETINTANQSNPMKTDRMDEEVLSWLISCHKDSEKSLSKMALSRSVGVSKQSVSKWFKTGKISKESLLKASAFYNKPLPAMFSQSAKPLSTPEISSKTNYVDEKIGIPLLEWSMVKDFKKALDAIEKKQKESIDLDPYLEKHSKTISTVKTSSKRINDISFALKMENESLSGIPGVPSFPKGSILIVKPFQDDQYESTKIIVALVGEEKKVVIKQMITEGEHSFLKSLNPIFPIIKVDKGCDIVGEVVRVIFDL